MMNNITVEFDNGIQETMCDEYTLKAFYNFIYYFHKTILHN